MAYVYILTNKSNTLYVGSTVNLESRIKQHSKTNKNHFTNKYNITRLIYFKEFNALQEAVAMERKIKGWTRKKKIALIKSINPEFKDLLLVSDIKSEILH